jgi:hypothetical protein
LPRPLRSAFRVWPPSWRFTPRSAWSGLFRPDSVRGILPSEPSPPERWLSAFPRRRTRLPLARRDLPEPCGPEPVRRTPASRF